MSDKEKLDLACSQLRNAIKNASLDVDYKKKWAQFALRGSVQTQAKKRMQNSRY